MLSLEKGQKLLKQINKDSKVVRTIRYNPNEKNKTDYEVDDLSQILSEDDFKETKQKYKLSIYDLHKLKSIMKKNGKDEIENLILLKAYEMLESKADDRMKNQLIFDSYEDRGYSLVPAVPNNGFMVVTLQGVSGSGKSYLASKIIQANHQKDQPIFLFSRQLKNIDPAFEPFEDKMTVVDLTDENELYDIALEDLEDSWVIFDDIEALPPDIREYLMELINSIATAGRKLKIKMLYSGHSFKGSRYTLVLSESHFHIMYPSSSVYRTKNLLRLKFTMPTSEVKHLFTVVKKDKSRYLMLHQKNPNFYATNKRISLF